MKTELEKKLLEEFPSFFRDMYGDPRKTCMAWGCAHGDGWFDILYQLCKKLKKEVEKDPKVDFHFLQIKEKFARLTLYYSGGNKTIHRLVNEAEQKSDFVCEDCGTMESVSVDNSVYWLRTLCEECRNGRKTNPVK